MSLILEALSRAERERRASEQAVPDLLTPGPVVTAGRRSRHLWIVALTLAAAGACLLWWSLTRYPEMPGRPGGARQPAVQTVSGAAIDAAARPESAGDQGTSTDAVSVPRVGRAQVQGSPGGGRGRVDADDRQREAIAALYASAAGAPEVSARAQSDPPAPAAVMPDGVDRAGTSRAPAYAPIAEAPRNTPLPGPADTAPAASPGPGADAAGGGATESDLDLEALLQRVQEEQADAALLPHRAPMLASLSQRFRDRLPTLMYLRHDYRADGASSVVFNSRQLAAGQQLQGVRIEEILPDSVVLQFEGQEFRLRALNSWVNL